MSGSEAIACEVVATVTPDSVSIGSLEVEDYIASATSVCEGELDIDVDMVVAIHDGDDVIVIEHCPDQRSCSVEFTPSGGNLVRVVARARWTTQNGFGWTFHSPVDCLERGVVGQVDCFADPHIAT